MLKAFTGFIETAHARCSNSNNQKLNHSSADESLQTVSDPDLQATTEQVSAKQRSDSVPNNDFNVNLSTLTSPKGIKPIIGTTYGDVDGKRAKRKAPERSVPKIHECYLCCLTFPVASKLRSHVKEMHGSGSSARIICPQCGLQFSQKGSLGKHLATVHAKRRISCQFCAKSFGQSGDLNIHIRTVHEKQRPFKCESCGAAFGRRSQMNKHHRVVHENLKPHQCNLCDAKFGERQDLARHSERIHSSSQTKKLKSEAVKPRSTGRSKPV
eukprot:CAMPEP_0182441520 /NCGR_PEP_ID=MMETSP1172-20130603/497_1 /TAXON_ID=708627 /ORGANISM="Timspurckia oligopyrenoides, Strain CCMP3278" /LENGTH=268 /DNA_ID=CAMNT_0024635863 /DNA_START=394 /DNA_END=1200 /DNA_ORIENTATION=-